MSDFTGPGRNSEMSTIRSSQRVGWSFCSSSRWPGDSIWKQPSVSERADQLERRDRRRAAIASRSTFSPVVRAISSRAWRIEREHPHAQDVELQVPQQLDVVLVGLDHPVAVRAALERHAFDQIVARQHDPARVQRDVSREPVQSARPRGTTSPAARIGRLMPRSSGRRSIARAGGAPRCAGTLSRSPRARPRAGRAPCPPRGPPSAPGRCRSSRRSPRARCRGATGPCRRRPRAGPTPRRCRCRAARRASGS